MLTSVLKGPSLVFSFQFHLFKIKIKDRGVINFSFFTMNHFVYACIEREGGYVPKCMVVYSQGRSKKNDFFVYTINE